MPGNFFECTADLEEMAKMAEITPLELLPTVLDDTLCGVFAIWIKSCENCTLEEPLVYLSQKNKSSYLEVLDVSVPRVEAVSHVVPSWSVVNAVTTVPVKPTLP